MYLYANQQGCDGDRLYYDGCAMIALNGRIIAQGSQFSFTDVEVVSATIDIEDVRAHRARSSRSMQAAGSERYHRIEAPIALSSGKFDVIEELNRPAAPTDEVRYHTPEEEIAWVVSLPSSLNCGGNEHQQTGSCLLALGLPSSLPHTGLFLTA